MRSKKDQKKCRKAISRLKERGINESENVTTLIVLANAGLGNDVKRSELEMSLSNVIHLLEGIITPTNETFSIVICRDLKSAKLFMETHDTFLIPTPSFPMRMTVRIFSFYGHCVNQKYICGYEDSCVLIPKGLLLYDDFISADEESALLNYFSIQCTTESSKLKQRTVLHFGYEFDYRNNRADVGKPLIENPIPECCQNVLIKLESNLGKPYSEFNQLTVNIYNPGDGIPMHIDTHSVFSDEIISVSLNSDIIMDWHNPESGEDCPVDLRARSVCIMSSDARYLWKHGIASRKSDLVCCDDGKNFTKRQRDFRVSLTFRKVKQHPECCCNWPKFCDYQKDKMATINQENLLKNANQIEQEYVHDVYDKIANHFSSTRHSMWPRVKQFIVNQQVGSIGADIGCGNGKYFSAIKQQGYLLASDSSFNLCKIAADIHQTDLVQSNCLQMPFKSQCCDYFICIAVLHHLSTIDRRKDGIQKLCDILRPGGNGLIYVWALEQEKNGHKSQYIAGSRNSKVEFVQNSTDSVLPVHQNRTKFSSTDMLVPWCNKNKESSSSNDTVYTRYYHLFKEGELESLCLEIAGIKICDSWYDSGNWAVVLKKI